MNYLLDTNIISELKKRQPNSNVLSWFEATCTNQLYFSAITIGELRSGAIKKSKTDKEQGYKLTQWIDVIVAKYSEQILNIDLETCEEWAQLISNDNTNGIDSLIAAQAITKNMTLVTRNIKHFKMFNVKLLNPFEEQTNEI
jgi:predicted nucleic acid-binding protein